MTRGKKVLIGIGATLGAFVIFAAGGTTATGAGIAVEKDNVAMAALIVTLEALAEADAATLVALEAQVAADASRIETLETQAWIDAGTIQSLEALVDTLSEPTRTTTSTTTTTVPEVKTGHIGSDIAIVTRVVDGDTIEVEWADPGGVAVEETVRLIGIDTPEKNTCYAEEATDGLRSLTIGHFVRLVSDASDRDRYDRLLRYVWVYDSATETDGVFVNEELIRNGFARAHPYEPDTAYADTFDEIQIEATEAEIGIWAPDMCDEVEAEESSGTWSNGEPILASDFEVPECSLSYPTVCIPPSLFDKECRDIEFRNFEVTGSDPFGFDFDGDGIGCEN